MRNYLLFFIGLICTAQECAATKQEIQVSKNERVVHIVAQPFLHVYCKPCLEELLLARYGHTGLVYRRVPLTYRSTTVQIEKELDKRVLVYRPTLVIIQPGNYELSRQRRSCGYNFDHFPIALDKMVKRLREKNIKVILCSVVPIGASKCIDKLDVNNKGLKKWVDKAQDIAQRHGAIFVDLFTEAITWPMIARPPSYYDRSTHEKSWKLFLKQVCFKPVGPTIKVDFLGDNAEIDGLKLTDLKSVTESRKLSFSLESTTGSASLDLNVKGLPKGNYRLSIGKWLTNTLSEELASGVKISTAFIPKERIAEMQKEMKTGHEASDAYVKILNYQLPKWLKDENFEKQKKEAIEKAFKKLDDHDKKMRKIVTPASIRIYITPR